MNDRSPTAPDAIAVIGLGCWYPGASDPRALWENVLARRQQFRRIPAVRLPLDAYHDPDPTAPDKTYGTRAALVDGFAFDGAARRIPRSTVQSTDVVHWLALETALAALADAGYPRERIPAERAGVIVGNSLTGEQTRAQTMRLRWPYVRKALTLAAQAHRMSAGATDALAETLEGVFKSAFPPIDEDSLAGGLSNTIAGRICNFLDLHGGGYTVDGACASSLIAVATAAGALARHELDFALAGGVDVSLDTFELVGFAKTGALTRDEMRVYDRRADGFIPGEGCGFVVLKRLADARAAGDKVYAVVRGWGISSDGKGGITAPSRDGQALALRRAYTRAGYSPHAVAFIEGHGTGTALGDRTELAAVARALEADGAPPPRACGMTSFKSIVGHTKAAAGVGGFIKAVMAVNRRVLPPTAGCEEPSEVFAAAPGLYPILRGEVRDPAETLRAGVSAMGFGGINCHVTLESGDPPVAALAPRVPERAAIASWQSTEVVVLAAATHEALREQAREIARRADGAAVGELVDLAAESAAMLPPDGAVRAAVVARSPEELREKLDALVALLARAPAPAQVATSPRRDLWVGTAGAPRRIGFLFPGQGSQQLEMGAALVARHEWARDLVDRAEGWLRAAGAAQIAARIFRARERAADAAQLAQWSEELARTEVAQPAICLVALLWLRHLERLGVRPAAVGGHSLGELLAFHASGAFDARTLLELAALRGQAMAAEPDAAGVMASLGCTRDAAAEFIRQAGGGTVVVANINGPRQQVVSGARAGVAAVVALAEAAGVAARPLPVSNAFHSPFVAAAAERVRKGAAVPETFVGANVTLFSCLNGRAVAPGLALRDHFARQIVEPVDFAALAGGLAARCDLLVEVGPGRVLSGLVADVVGPAGVACLPVAGRPDHDRDLNVVLAALFAHGVAVRWDAVYESRLVRPFVAASTRRFIENPCERPLADPGSRSPLGSGAIEAHLADVPPAVINEYLGRRGTFLAAVARADLGAVEVPRAPAPDRSAAVAALPVTAPSVVPEGETAIADLLLERIASRTGFPRDGLSMDLRLLDDLNLDSIKAAEFVGEAARHLGVAGRLDPAEFARARLAEVAAALAVALRAARPVAPADAGSPTASDAPGTAAAPSWVRHFAVQHVPTTATAAPDDLAGATVLVLHPRGDAADAKAFALAAEARGARVTCATADASAGDVSHVIALVPGPTAAGASFDEALTDTIELLHAAARAARRGTVAFVQVGGDACATPEALHTAPWGRATAFAASLHLERPELRVRAVEISPSMRGADLAVRVLAELGGATPFVAAGYGAAGDRFVPTHVPLEPAADPPRAARLSAADVVLVTGGARGITAECALALADATGARLALVGSSPDPADAADAPGSVEIARTLARATAAEVVCRYYACDVTDGAAVARLVARVRSDLGPVTAVVHGAAVNRPRRVEQATAAEAREEVGPKVLGAWNLCRALDDAPPRLVVALGSIIGVTGMMGNAWYGFSNEVLDAVLRGFCARHPGTAALSIAYSVWGEVGMGARMGSVAALARRGVAPIPTDEGVRRFVHLCTHDPGRPLVVVAARLAGLDTWATAARHAAPPLRFQERVVRWEPGVEAATRVDLSLARDPHLRDHEFRGTLLFPTVFGLEAMAQVVALAAGDARFGALRIEDVQLARPIAVDPVAGAEIEVWAEVAERDAPAAPRRVRAGIRTAQTGFARDHFAATFVLGAATVAPVAPVALPACPLDIRPREDLYGWLLFQGPRYQRLRAIHALDARECVFEAESAPPSAPPEEVAAPWLLGDPFFRDALLQAPQVVVSRDVVLPTHIDLIEIFPSADEPFGVRRGLAIFEGQVDRQFLATVHAVDSSGHVVERLSGYKQQLLEHHAEHPGARDIATPDARDTAALRRELARLGDQFGVAVPAAVVTHAAGLHALPASERRAQEVPIFAAALAARLGDGASPPSIEWLASGRPRVAGVADRALDVALAHDERTCLCVAGDGAQGCDLVTVTARSEAAWANLLGRRAEALQSLVGGGDPMDLAGARVWAAAEAAFKATGTDAGAVALERRAGPAVIFQVASPEGRVLVLTLPMRWTRGPERVVAVVVRERAASSVDPESAGARLGFAPERHGVTVTENGPQGQAVVELRFPVTFRDLAGPGRAIYFTHFFEWMGRLREVACEPVVQPLATQFGTGRWGMVTNAASTRVYGTAAADDVIEGRIWLERLAGAMESTMDLRYEWRRLRSGSAPEVIAASFMRVTWVIVRDHGVVEVEPLPDYLRNFVDAIRPRTAAPPATDAPPDLGALVHRVHAGPSQQVALGEREFETTYEDANLVGNIYFANYAVWQGRVRDAFVHAACPAALREGANRGELRCLGVEVEHLREAMPFDRIAVQMSLDAVHERGVRLRFDYHRVGPDGAREKLAHSTHAAAWHAPGADGAWAPTPLPPTLRSALLAAVR